ncbi:MAG: NPCBM/NEW2 domain-containing protein [Candidatus Zipacnadales bacterium]
MTCGRVVRIVWLCSAVLQTAYAEEDQSVEYLSDLLGERLLFYTQGWGELGVDTACHAPGKEPRPLQIGERTYKKGLGHHANGEFLFALDGQYEALEMEVGVLWQQGTTGTVVFQVFVDGEQCYDSGVVHERDGAQPVRVELRGGELLRLVAIDAGDGITCDCACWAEARLIRDRNAVRMATDTPLDIAPFGMVASWDPRRVGGTLAGRTEIFPPEDVFLHRDLSMEPDGTYFVPVVEGVGCIGLQWIERRLLRDVALEFAGAVPSPEGVRVEYWVGESWWQGRWESLPGILQTDAHIWTYRINWLAELQMSRRMTQKVRWLIPDAGTALRVRRLRASTRLPSAKVGLRVEAEGAQIGEKARLEVYNGEFVDGELRYAIEWEMAEPLTLKVRHTGPLPVKSDCTALWFTLPEAEGRRVTRFAVAVEDVLESGSVYVPEAGVLVVTEQSGVNLATYRRRVRGKRTVLDMVRRKPDQSFMQAVEHVHRSIQNNGPMLVSLGCNNRKWQVNRDGSVQFNLSPDVPHSGHIDYPLEIRPRFGSGKLEGLTRKLHGSWLPIPIVELEEEGLHYVQRTYAAPCLSVATDASICVMEISARNCTKARQEAKLSLTFLVNRHDNTLAELEPVENGFTAMVGGRVMAWVDLLPKGEWVAEATSGVLTLRSEVAVNNVATIVVRIPSWETSTSVCPAGEASGELEDTERYWWQELIHGAQLNLPEPLLADVIRASQVHCLIAARNEGEGQRIAPWISSDRYGPLESEAHSIILGMDLLGHHDFARRSLEFFIRRYNEAGYLTTGYTMMGTGWHLWTLAEHYWLTRDEEWLRSVASEVERVCRWIVIERMKTKRLLFDGSRPPEYGLMPPGVAADWGMYANRFFCEAHFCAGLREAARALLEIGHPGAEELLKEAQEYAADIRAAYQWTQQRTPVRPLRDGTWVPACPAMVQCLGKVGEFFPGEDGGRTWAGDVELGPQHLFVLGVMDANLPDAEWLTEFFEDQWCLHDGMGAYPAEESEADPFNLGGFSKVQPYYTRMTDLYALRDGVKPFIRAYFNAIPSLLNLETLSFWEHFHNGGGWNKTHETGWFLQQTRTMLLTERGEELWLAPFLPSYWLAHGQEVAVRHAPTHFGEVSYRIRSQVEDGIIRATIDPPRRNPPEALVIRLRHPEGRRMQRVWVNGAPHRDFNAGEDWVRLKRGATRITVEAMY